MNKEQKIVKYDPSSPGIGNIFGLPFTIKESDLVLILCPFEVTSSYGIGTDKGPKSIKEASYQVDLYSDFYPKWWKRGVASYSLEKYFIKLNKKLRPLALKQIIDFTNKENENKNRLKILEEEIFNMIKVTSKKISALLKKNKIIGIIGGEHTVTLAALNSYKKVFSEFGILQIDAHADLRESFENIKYSHASVMRNAIAIPQIKKIVQVGTRDISSIEVEYIKKNKNRIKTFYDNEINRLLFTKTNLSWANICDNIIKELPQRVYITFDIDGLQPQLCPDTGTPVPGGLTFEQAIFLIQRVSVSGRQIIGFDIVEVVPGKNKINSIVAAKVLMELCVSSLYSNCDP